MDGATSRMNRRWAHLKPSDAHILAEEIRQSPQLAEVDVAGNNLRNAGTKVLCSGLASSHSVMSLDIGRNAMGNEGAIALSEAIKSSCPLQFVNCEWNLLEDEGLTALASAVRYSDLIALDVHGNSFGSEGLAHLGTAVRRSSALSALELGWNAFGDEGLAAFFKGSISQMALEEQAMEPVCGDDTQSISAAAAGAALPTAIPMPRVFSPAGLVGLGGQCPLTHLDLGRTSLTDKSALLLATGLSNSRITHLNLAYNNLSHISLLAYTQVWKASGAPPLQSLCMASNPLGRMAATAWKMCLPLLQETITSLDLTACNLGFGIGEALGECMPEMKQLTTLDIAKNDMQMNGFRLLCSRLSLWSQQALHVDLSSNALWDAACDEGTLDKMGSFLLIENAKIEKLVWQFSGNKFPRAMTEKLGERHGAGKAARYMRFLWTMEEDENNEANANTLSLEKRLSPMRAAVATREVTLPAVVLDDGPPSKKENVAPKMAQKAPPKVQLQPCLSGPKKVKGK